MQTTLTDRPLNVSAEARDLAAHAAAPGHTPGPWRWVGHSLRAVTPAPDRSAVHTILDAEGGCGFLASNVHDTMREIDADLRLIAAAPDMLAVLIELRDSAAYWSEYDVPLGIVCRINDAIRKATGQPVATDEVPA